MQTAEYVNLPATKHRIFQNSAEGRKLLFAGAVGS